MRRKAKVPIANRDTPRKRIRQGDRNLGGSSERVLEALFPIFIDQRPLLDPSHKIVGLGNEITVIAFPVPSRQRSFHRANLPEVNG